ncbi:MAG: hypothetical protein FWD23_04135 [Oscillospiraceae bacterium]|nr:hypothetical protein [Oscillospiraceae bacterium]
MKSKRILTVFAAVTAAVFLLALFAACEKEQDLSKLFEEGELGDFWDFQPDNDEIVQFPNENDQNGDEIVIEGDVLNMDSVRLLAQKQLTPFEFMEVYPGTVSGGDPFVYLNALPNDYVIRIEYSGKNVNYANLEDHRLGLSLDLLGAGSMDMFLLEREP